MLFEVAGYTVWLREAEKGDIDAARKLAKHAAKYIERGETLPEVLRMHMVAALRAGSEGRSVDAALKLRRGKGQKRPLTNYEQDVAELVWQIRRGKKIPLRDNMKGPGAFSLAAELAKERGIEHPKGETLTRAMAEKYWKRWRDLFSTRSRKI